MSKKKQSKREDTLLKKDRRRLTEKTLENTLLEDTANEWKTKEYALLKKKPEDEWKENTRSHVIDKAQWSLENTNKRGHIIKNYWFIEHQQRVLVNRYLSQEALGGKDQINI